MRQKGGMSGMEDKAVIIKGSSSGIAEATALLLANRVRTVVVAALPPAPRCGAPEQSD
jgi:NAD(P)-dependent dehydrogenase (short-subunit alcohol dehydrogenase family)